jgi:hypothetical protein
MTNQPGRPTKPQSIRMTTEYKKGRKSTKPTIGLRIAAPTFPFLTGPKIAGSPMEDTAIFNRLRNRVISIRMNKFFISVLTAESSVSVPSVSSMVLLKDNSGKHKDHEVKTIKKSHPVVKAEL